MSAISRPMPGVSITLGAFPSAVFSPHHEPTFPRWEADEGKRPGRQFFHSPQVLQLLKEHGALKGLERGLHAT